MDRWHLKAGWTRTLWRWCDKVTSPCRRSRASSASDLEPRRSIFVPKFLNSTPRANLLAPSSQFLDRIHFVCVSWTVDCVCHRFCCDQNHRRWVCLFLRQLMGSLSDRCGTVEEDFSNLETLSQTALGWFDCLSWFAFVERIVHFTFFELAAEWSIACVFKSRTRVPYSNILKQIWTSARHGNEIGFGGHMWIRKGGGTAFRSDNGWASDITCRKPKMVVIVKFCMNSVACLNLRSLVSQMQFQRRHSPRRYANNLVPFQRELWARCRGLSLRVNMVCLQTTENSSASGNYLAAVGIRTTFCRTLWNRTTDWFASTTSLSVQSIAWRILRGVHQLLVPRHLSSSTSSIQVRVRSIKYCHQPCKSFSRIYHPANDVSH